MSIMISLYGMKHYWDMQSKPCLYVWGSGYVVVREALYVWGQAMRSIKGGVYQWVAYYSKVWIKLKRVYV